MALVPDRVCVIVGRTRHKMVTIELEEAVKRGAKFIELRLDYLAKAVDFKRMLPLKKCPWVATLRRPVDGGRWAGSEEERQTIIRQAIVSGFDWIDLETDIADSIRRFGTVKRIISYHNFKETPDDLEGIFRNMLKQDGDVYKIAVTAQTPMDNLRILKLIEKSPKPLVAHCMGEMGIPSRMLSLKYGSPFIYAAFNKERGIAPGLPSMDELHRQFHVEGINKQTQVYGVLGDPVGHSFSPLLHNQIYKHIGINAVYVPFRVPRGMLPQMLKAWSSVPVDGYSVTIPHKEAAASISSQIDDRVAETQAANTLVRKPNGFHAFNTDYEAALDSILSNLPKADNQKYPDITGKNALILGAGGAARAIAHALHKQGANIKVTSRTPEKSAKLAEEVGGKAVDWEARHNSDCDILVNCTPIGMFPKVDESPVHHSYLSPGMTVFDMIYTPENTLLIKEARQRSCNAISGIEMFVRQAAKQVELFLGKVPDLDVMREILRKAVSPAQYTLNQPVEKPVDNDTSD
jgi:3-dehydroquinate dehydratase / shikimate dehydrogenase